MTTPTCLIKQTDCGRTAADPICPKCGLDERMRYTGEEAALLAKSQALENYKAAESSDALSMDWGYAERPRLPGGWIDVDNESLVIAEDLDWGSPPSYRGVIEAGRRRIERIKTAAESGETTAKLMLGRMLLDGFNSLAASPTQTHVLYRQALDAGNEAACSYLGALFENGDAGLPQDQAKARTWYERGAAAGDARAMAFLAAFLAEGKGGLEKNENKALAMLKNAAGKGSGFALLMLYEAVVEGKWGMKIDQEQAARLLDLALARGLGHAAIKFGWLAGDVKAYLGQNTKTLIEKVACGSLCSFSDDSNPLKIFTGLIEGFVPNLVINGADNEWVEDEDDFDAEAHVLLLSNCFAWAYFGMPNAMYFVAQRLCFKKTAADQTESAKWLQRAAEDGNPAAMYFYGRLLFGVNLFVPTWPWVRENLHSDFHTSMSEGKQWLERAAQQDQTFAMLDLGIWLVLTGKPEDQASAAHWLEKAAQANFYNAYRWLTTMYSKGFRDGWDSNPEAAERYCRLGAEAGVPYCMERLGATLYARKQYEEALRWFSAAAEAGVPEAFCGMAAYHYNGDGPQSDPAQALHWAQRGVDADVPEAMRILGMIYWNGKGGVNVDLAMAEQWLQKAVEKGDEPARFKLDCLQQEIRWHANEETAKKESGKGFWARFFSS